MKHFTQTTALLFTLLTLASTEVLAQLPDFFQQKYAVKATEIKVGMRIALYTTDTQLNNKWARLEQVGSGNNGLTTPLATPKVIYSLESSGDTNYPIVFKRVSDGKYLAKNGASLTWQNEKTQAINFKVVDPKNNHNTTNVQFPTWDQNKEYMVRFTASDGTNHLNLANKLASGNGSYSFYYAIKMPRMMATASINGSFDGSTVWQKLYTANGKAVMYDTKDQKVKVADENVTSNYWWAVTGNETTGYSLYNGAAGADKVLTNAENGLTMAEAAPAARAAVQNKWQFHHQDVTSGNTLPFCLSLQGDETQKITEGAKGELEVASTGNAVFSTTYVQYYETLLTSLKKAPKMNAVNGMTEEGYNTIQAVNNISTVEDLKKIHDCYTSSTMRVLFNTKQPYLLQNVQYQDKYMTITNTSANGSARAENNASQIWMFSDAENGCYKMSAQGQKLNLPATSTPITHTNTAAGADFYVQPLNLTSCNFTMGGTSAQDKIHCDGASKIVGWGVDSKATQWYLVPATQIKVTVGQAGYATANYPFAVQLPEDLKAYTAKVASNNGNDALVLTEVPGGKVPANTPVVLQGEAKEYTLNILTEEVASVAESENVLSGTLLGTTLNAATKAYVLAKVNNKVGFYLLDSSDRNLGDNKAYLLDSKLPAASMGAQAFSFVFDDSTTGIEQVESENTEAEQYFDLQGRAVKQPKRGIYLTRSGKKILINQ